MSKGKGRTAGQHNFAQIPRANIERSTFNRSCGLKTTFDSGKLIPIFVDEALPGDTINMKMTTFARLATPLHPVLDNMWMDYQFWAVPMRLVWENWAKFNGAQDDPGDSTDYLIPTMDAPASGGHLNESLSDYLGIPTKIDGLTHSSMWHRAYNLIWNEWYRDQNLQDSLVVDRGDGPDDTADYEIKRRGKRHDYFTSALTAPQKGDAVQLGLGGTVPVDFPQMYGEIQSSGGSGPELEELVSGAKFEFETVAGSANANYDAPGDVTGPYGMKWGDPGLVYDNSKNQGTANLDTATLITINQLRQGVQLQKMYERDARGGTRLTEVVKAHFGVTSPDSRLQRPEFLGGGKNGVKIHPVPQTSATEEGTELGNLAAFGTAGGSAGFVKSFTEHCLIIGLVSVRADLNYQQGLPRMFSRSTRFDFYWPALAHLGEQGIYNREIYATGIDGVGGDDEIFGYQERYAEYRYKPSTVTGKMRSNDAVSLDTWHLAQDFASLPVLGDSFIQDNPPVSRVVAVPSEPEFIFDAYFDFKHTRPMPTYGVPGQMDRF